MVDIDEIVGRVRGLKDPKKQEPIAEFKLNYDAFAETLEPVYYWLLDFMQDHYGLNMEVEKISDNFMATPGGGYFADIGIRATRMQDQGMKILATINTVMRSVLNLIYDLKEFEIRLQHYDTYHSKEPKKREGGVLSLKQIWMDRVDIRRGAGSINLLTAQLDFVTLRDAFMAAKFPENADKMKSEDVAKKLGEDVDKMDLNERVKRILKSRLGEFADWTVRSERELRNRYDLQRAYLKSQVNALKLYTRWVKPYLRAAEELMMKYEVGRAELVTAFNTIVLELILFGKSEINVQRAVDFRLLPEKFRHMKFRQKYYACIFLDFTFRGLPRIASRAEAAHYVHSGRTNMVFKAYVLNDDEIALMKKELEKQEIYEGLRLVEGITRDSLDILHEDLMKYMEEEKKEEEKPKKTLWQWLLGIEPTKKKKAEQKLRKEIFYERQVRDLVGKKEVFDKLFRLYDLYKKAHDMGSPPEEFTSRPGV